MKKFDTGVKGYRPTTNLRKFIKVLCGFVRLSPPIIRPCNCIFEIRDQDIKAVWWFSG